MSCSIGFNDEKPLKSFFKSKISFLFSITLGTILFRFLATENQTLNATINNTTSRKPKNLANSKLLKTIILKGMAAKWKELGDEEKAVWNEKAKTPPASEDETA